MTKVNQDFTVYQGADYTVTINVDKANGTPKDMTGGSGIWGAFRSAGDPLRKALILKQGSDMTIVDVDGTGDGLQFALTATELARLDGVFHHEAKGTDAMAITAVLTTGKMTVKPSATTA